MRGAGTRYLTPILLACLALGCAVYAASEGLAYAAVGAIAPVKGGFCEPGEAQSLCVDRYELMGTSATVFGLAALGFTALSVIRFRKPDRSA